MEASCIRIAVTRRKLWRDKEARAGGADQATAQPLRRPAGGNAGRPGADSGYNHVIPVAPGR